MIALPQPLKVLFIDHQDARISDFWNEIGKEFSESFGDSFERYFQIIPFSKFSSEQDTMDTILAVRPDIIVLGIGLGVASPNGVELAQKLDQFQKKYELLNYYIFANTDGDPSEFVVKGTAAVCGSCKWNPSRTLNLFIKVHTDTLTYNDGRLYPMSIMQKRFSESFSTGYSGEKLHELESCIRQHLSNESVFADESQLFQDFIKVRKNTNPQHGYWVHSLSHFDNKLWELGKIEVIKKLYCETVQGAIISHDLNCLGRIISVFKENYSPTLGPKDEFGFSSENLDKLIAINNFYFTRVQSLMGCYVGPEWLESIRLL
jgi:hypothetical protein